MRVCVVVRLILKRNLSVFLNAFLVTGSLAVGSLLLNDELLARVGVDLSDLGKWLLKLSLLLLVLLEALLALVRCQLRVGSAFREAVIA